MEIVEGDLGKWRILDRISNEILQGERKKKKKKKKREKEEIYRSRRTCG